MTNMREMEEKANRLQNSTIAKLNRKEANLFGMFSLGVMLYKGTLKTRKQGWKTVKVNDFQTNFVGECSTFEFIKMVSADDDNEEVYGMRVRDNETNSYLIDVMPLWGIDFFKH